MGNNTSSQHAAWNDFWAQNTQRQGSVDGGGCLPQRWAVIEQAQQDAWRGFISDLPEQARILDLATGDGRVLRWMREIRDDLNLIGIDLAPRIPAPPDGIETRGGIAMEDLPFDDDEFDAVVSQFGFEYGNVSKVAAEIARVLKPSGKVGLMLHRGDGPILEHNSARRAQLLWVLKEKSVPRRVKVALKAKHGGFEKAEAIAGKFATLGAEKFSQQSPAWEIPEAIRRSVLMGRQHGAASITQTIAAIEAQAKNELGRIASLARACTTADARDAIVDGFVAHQVVLRSTDPVSEPSGRALADFVTFD